MKFCSEKIIPHTAVVSVIIIILSAVFGIVNGDDNRELYIDLLCMIAMIALLSWVEFGVLSQIEFRKAAYYLIASFLLWYVGIGLFLFGRNWWGFHASNLLQYSVITILVYTLVTRWNIKRLQKDAEEINDILKKREQI